MSMLYSAEEIREFEELELERKRQAVVGSTLHGAPLNPRHKSRLREKRRQERVGGSIPGERTIQAMAEEEADSGPSTWRVADTGFTAHASRDRVAMAADGYMKERMQAFLKDDSDSKFAQSLAAAAAAAPFNGPRVLTEEVWDELKPVIRRLHIEEKRTLADIVDVLSRLHNVHPT